MIFDYGSPDTLTLSHLRADTGISSVTRTRQQNVKESRSDTRTDSLNSHSRITRASKRNVKEPFRHWIYEYSHNCHSQITRISQQNVKEQCRHYR